MFQKQPSLFLLMLLLLEVCPFSLKLYFATFHFLLFFFSQKLFFLLGHMSKLACSVSQIICSIATFSVDPIFSIPLITDSLFVFNSLFCEISFLVSDHSEILTFVYFFYHSFFNFFFNQPVFSFPGFSIIDLVVFT